MQCPPCHRAMELVDYIDAHEQFPLVWMKGWRCPHCGYAVNPLGEFNRWFLAFDVPPLGQEGQHGEISRHPSEIPPFESGQIRGPMVGFWYINLRRDQT